MSVSDISKNTLVGYCVFQYLDFYTNDYRGHIEDTIKVVGKDTTTQEICNIDSPYINSEWNFEGKFYTISPVFRPIPYNMIMIGIRYTLSMPRRIKEVFVQYDILDLEDFILYIVCYNEKIPNTIPLYFLEIGGSIVPTFNKEELKKRNPGFKDYYIPVIYVLKNDINKFSCYEGNIIQDTNSDKTFYANILNCKYKTFFNIVENMKKKNNIKNIQNYNNISKQTSDDPEKFLCKYNNTIVVLIIGLILVMFLLLLILKIRA